ncbi:MAG TPA: flagellar biosynthetic protein FliO [Opitutus sp.]|nr:flagellar biosynthetic protein FliO [Opitutus sp.]
MSPAQSRPWLRDLSRSLRAFAPFVALTLEISALGAPVHNDEVIVPNSALAANAPAAAPATGSGPLTVIGVLVLAGAGGWILWRARAGGLSQVNRVARKLTVEETRSLGNRQYLVVASYQDKKFLIGVCPGRIDLLSALHASEPADVEKSLS